MEKVNTKISIDADFKKADQELFADLGLDMNTSVTAVARENPNAETAEAMAEYYTMKLHPEMYKRYASFKDAVDEVLTDA